MSSIGGQSGADETTVQEVSRRIAAGERLFLLDVREPFEYEEAHIAGSTLIPLGELTRRVAEIPRDTPIVAVCRSGQRSGLATEMLRRAGYDAVNMGGGMIAWVRAGLPSESDD
jgi:rhodanese-related sulfurtransferase